MAIIQCPHCEKDIELDAGSAGLFDCPYCEQQFSWGNVPQSHTTRWFDLWIGLLIPSLTIFPGVPIMLFIFEPQGLEVLIYLIVGIISNISTTIILGLIGLRTQRYQLALGALSSPIISGIILWIYVDIGF
jgi:hypothetical protein